jgi:hypothetical protein
MLWDSPSERLRLRHRALTWFPLWPELEARRQGPSAGLEDIDLNAFDDGTTLISLNAVSVFVSKSGSVFYPALDALDRTCEHLKWPPTAWNFWGVGGTLRDFHLFDDGNRKAITWVDHKSNEPLSLMDPHSHLGLGLDPSLLKESTLRTPTLSSLAIYRGEPWGVQEVSAARTSSRP